MTDQSSEPYNTPRVRELLQAANDSARLFRTVFLSFMIVALYVLIIALSANDELLFKDGPLQAPILNVSVQASHYFIGIPWILLLLHVNLLIQAIFLARKTEDYRQALSSSLGRSHRQEMLRLLFPVPLAQLAGAEGSGVPSWLLKLFVFAVLVLLPLITLGVIQAQFLDFQNTWITRMHSGVLLFDLAMVACLWPRVRTLYVREKRSRQLLSLVGMAAVVAVFFVVGPLFPVLLGKVDMGSNSLLDDIENRLRSLHFLDVQNRRLYLRAEDTIPNDACTDGTLALNLNGRSYRDANLSESVLCNAVLTNAQLQGAILRETGLDGADLRNAELQGASLRGARLRGVQLQGAQFQGADLTDAQLQRVVFPGAQLQGTDLSGTQLERADLSGGQLQGAFLWETDLTGADLSRVRFQGALLLHTQLEDAGLEEAQFQGAYVLYTNFNRARTSEAQTQGYYFRHAEFQGVNAALPRSSDSWDFWDWGASDTDEEELWVAVFLSHLPGIYSIDIDRLRDAGLAYFLGSSFRERMEKSAGKPTNLTAICDSTRDFPLRNRRGDDFGLCNPMSESDPYSPRLENFERGSDRSDGPAIGVYTESDGVRWILEYEGALCGAFAFDFEFLLRSDVAGRAGVAEETVRKWIREGGCWDVEGASGGIAGPD